MPWGEPVVGASVGVEGGRDGALTGEDGTFTLPAPPGDQTFVASLDGVVLASLDVTVDAVAGLELGELEADLSTDGDQDGVPDAVEVVGWTIYLDATGRGRLTERRVTSDPAAFDTDGDGLSDAQELASLTDPRRDDTDGDALADLDEMRVYKSNPCDVDTDHDSRGPDAEFLPNPALFDGNEVSLSVTSPTLADTDGDGLTDYQEITGGGLAPVVADLPQLAISLNGDPSIRVIYDTTVTTNVQSKEMTLVQDSSKSMQSDAQSMRDTFSNETQITASAKVGGPPLSAGASVEATNTTKNVFALDWSSSTSRESVSQNSAEFQTVRSQITDTSASGGEFKAAFKVRNVSKRSLLVQDLSIAAYRMTPSSPTGFTIVDILGPKPVTQGTSSSSAFPAVVLAPDGEFTFVTQSRVLPLDQVEELLTKPSSLFFEVANYALFQVDDLGAKVRDYAAIGERVLERCGAVTIDFGNGEVDRDLIATNVRRNPDGSSAGLPVPSALATMGFPFETREFLANADGGKTGTGLQVLWSVTDRRGRKVAAFGDVLNDFETPWKTVPPVGFWVVLATNRASEPVTRETIVDGTGTPLLLPRPLDEVVLKNGERVSLVFVRDTDGDGLFDSEESLLGTDPRVWDTDRDGLSDGYEVKARRTIAFHGEGYGGGADYASTSDPLLVDTDGDGLTDREELDLGTDPLRADTDGDLVEDPFDPSPLDPPAGGGVSDVGLVVWYPLDRMPDSSPARTFEQDSTQSAAKTLALQGMGDPDEQDILQTGLREGANAWPDRFDILRRSVRLQQESHSPTSFFESPDLGLPGDGKLTIAGWIRRASGSTTTGLLCFDDSTGIVWDDGAVRFRGRVGGQLTTLATGFVPPLDRWTFVAATVSPPTVPGSTAYVVRLYRDDGTLVMTDTLPGLPATAGKLMIGAFRDGASSSEAWNGAIDDVRVYRRALTPAEVRALYRERNYLTSGR
jgi:hypothetical protein